MLPAHLRAGPGVRTSGFDFSSWIESTIDELQEPGHYDDPAHKSRTSSMNDVPWMQEEQDASFTTLRPRKYRETPIYSDPGSAIVSFPYCGCEGLGSASYHKHSASADPDIRGPAPLFSDNNKDNNSFRCSGSTLVDEYNRHSDVGTFGRQRATSGGSTSSDLSAKSQEERASEAAWMMPLPASTVPVIGSIISPTVFSPTTTEGYPSMPCTPGVLLDAHTACLSPYKPMVVQVSTTSHSRDTSVSSMSTLDLPMLQPLAMGDFPRLPSSPVSPLEPRAMGERRKLNRAATTPVGTTPALSTADLISPLWGISDHSLAQHRNRSRSPSIGSKLNTMATSGIVADIMASVQDFPAKMLCLDTPCIVAIRHDMHAERTPKRAPMSAVSSPSSIYSTDFTPHTSPKFQRSTSILRQGSVRGRSSTHIGNFLKAPLPLSLRAGTPPPAPPLSRTTSTLLRPDRYSPTMDMLSYYRNDLDTEILLEDPFVQERSHLKCPDLSAIAEIFPESDGWWQSTLYAHLIAYNYITRLQSSLPDEEKPRGRPVPAKAGRVMGLPKTAMMSEGGWGETRYTKVLEDLEKCMVRIMKSMMGRTDMVSGLSSPGGVLGKGELALVRALSQVVKCMDV